MFSLATNEGQYYRSVASTHPVWWDAEEGWSVHMQPWKERLVFTSTMTELQQADDVAQLYMHNINQIRNCLPYLFCIITYCQT
jgi:hypothetical protein